MQPQKPYKGPGQWRSAADGAQRPDSIFAHLAEAARLLQDRGLGEAQQAVHEAEAALQSGDHERASMALREAARQAQDKAPAYAQGLRAMADEVIRAMPPAQPGKPGRDADETTEQHPALEE